MQVLWEAQVLRQRLFQIMEMGTPVLDSQLITVERAHDGARQACLKRLV